MKQALNLFFKYPEIGRVKTRLSSKLSNDFVFLLYREFIRDIIKASKMADADLILSISSHSEKTVSDYSNEFGAPAYHQKGDDLGERMYNSLKEIFLAGYEKCVLIGSDIPDISAPLLNKAFDKLTESDIVLGPSSDGGYYLLGFNCEKLHKGVFEEIQWSCSHVLEKTLKNISTLKLNYHLLEELNDIDDLEDLKNFYRRNRGLDSYTIRFLTQKLEEFYEQL
jgi:rSAM/selenodomain-associated transferase 1